MSPNIDDAVFEVLSPAVAPNKPASRQKAAKKHVQKKEKMDENIQVITIPTVAEQKREAIASKKRGKCPKTAQNTGQVRRAALTEIEEEVLSERLHDQNKSKVVPKSNDFDALLADKKAAMPMEVSQKAKTVLRLSKKRVSFDDNVTVMKHRRTSSIDWESNEVSILPLTQHEPEIQQHNTKEQVNSEFDDDDDENFPPLTQHPQSKKQTDQVKEVANNFYTLKDKHILGKYMNQNEDTYKEKVITNTQRISTITKNHLENYESFEIVRRDQIRVQKKLSPTFIRTVQIQEISYSQPNSDYNEEDDELARRFKEKAGQALEPMVEEIKKVRRSIDDLKKPELKAKLRQAVVNCRNSKDRLRTHAHEHVKLLKRLHHSKRQIMQLYDEDVENVSALLKAVEQVSTVDQKACNDELQKINDIRQAAYEKQEEIKQEI
jgi:hypothetical protein